MVRTTQNKRQTEPLVNGPSTRIGLILGQNEAVDLLNHLVSSVKEGDQPLEAVINKLVDALRNADRNSRVSQA